MTEKQEKILEAALRLFATEGYASTPTCKVAKEAGVSEGLIFRHYKSKEGLLDAVVADGMSRIKGMFADIVLATDPHEVISKTIHLPFQVRPENYEFWRLTYALKWQAGYYAADVSEPVRLALANAFGKLGSENPEAEAHLLMATLDGLATMVLLHPAEDMEGIKSALLRRYGV